MAESADRVANASLQGLDKYEIAEPVAYPAFSPPATPPALPRLNIAIAEFVSAPEPSTAPAGPYRETWDDGDETPRESGQKFTIDLTRSTLTRSSLIKAIEAENTDATGVREKRAIWIVHGMGQQIPFETVDSLTQGLRSVASPKDAMPRLRTVKLGDQTMQRVELDVDGVEKDAAGNPLRRYELHLYEAYWAPETEGVAKLQDVVSFLLDGALRGLLNSLQGFRRAMFGDMEAFRISILTPFYISVTLLILVALVIINGVIVTAGAIAAASSLAALKAGLPSSGAIPLVNDWPQLTALASCMTAVALTFGTLLFLAEISRPDNLLRSTRAAISVLGWIGFWITAVAIIGTGALFALATRSGWSRTWLQGLPAPQLQVFATLLILSCGVLVAVSMAWRGHLRSSEQVLRANPLLLLLLGVAFGIHIMSVAIPILLMTGHGSGLALPRWLQWAASTIWVWPFLIVLSAKIRTIMVEYVGDVAIYVQPNKLDRFSDVRNKIKKTASDLAAAVYLACEPGTNDFLYQDVAAVGHSLGSVIAYDTLNRLMLDDWLGKNHLGIANRTNSLVTFGSPLDKTAFFFTIQGKDTLHIRERLAATVQPIIESYRKFRKFRWINVYSHNDIVSGKLVFYDRTDMQTPREVPPLAVHNLIDHDASVPLVAHVDYWKNELVWNELMKQIAP